MDVHWLVKTRQNTVRQYDVRRDRTRHAQSTVTTHAASQSSASVSKRRCWVHTFVQDRDGKNTLQNVVIELSSEREKFYSFKRIASEIVENLLELVRTELRK
jgi:hypothetical protein